MKMTKKKKFHILKVNPMFVLSLSTDCQKPSLSLSLLPLYPNEPATWTIHARTRIDFDDGEIPLHSRYRVQGRG